MSGQRELHEHIDFHAAPALRPKLQRFRLFLLARFEPEYHRAVEHFSSPLLEHRAEHALPADVEREWSTL